MVVGPTGVGKEGAAIFLHNQRDASCKKLEQLNMAAFSEKLIGSDLFGHVKGHYTGAIDDREGVFEFCKDEGMVVLDEFLSGMESLQKTMQPMLLRVLEDAFVVKLGDKKRKQQNLKVLVMATTNEFPTLKELEQAVAEKRVRGDLIARFPNRYELLPISRRPLEILPSFLWALNKSSKNGQTAISSGISTKFTVDALKLLLHFNYPENFRQLQHAATQIAKSTIYKATPVITKELVLNALMNRSSTRSEGTKLASDDSRSSSCSKVTAEVQCGQRVIEVSLIPQTTSLADPNAGVSAADEPNGPNSGTSDEVSTEAKLNLTVHQKPTVQFYKVTKWTKPTGDMAKNYEELLEQIVIGKVFKNKLPTQKAKSEKKDKLHFAKLTKMDEEITQEELNLVVQVLCEFLRKKFNDDPEEGLKTEFKSWLRRVHKQLSTAFPESEGRGQLVYQLTDGENELTRAMIVWLLSGLRITETEFLDILELQEEPTKKKNTSHSLTTERDDNDN